jgi:hypothetical protein
VKCQIQQAKIPTPAVCHQQWGHQWPTFDPSCVFDHRISIWGANDWNHSH